MLLMEEIETALHTFILEEFLPGEDPEDLTYDIELVSTGILDSVSVIKVVAYMEEFYNLEITPLDASIENMNTIASMASLIFRKTDANS